MATTEFVFNNKVYTATKSLPFKVNYGKELRIGFKIRKKKYTKAEVLVKEINKIHEKAKAILKKLQKEIKKYVDKNRKEMVEYKIENKEWKNL